MSEVTGPISTEPEVVVAQRDELLAALKAMIAWSEEPDPESKSARTTPLMDAWANARAAIAKVEGRS